MFDGFLKKVDALRVPTPPLGLRPHSPPTFCGSIWHKVYVYLYVLFPSPASSFFLMCIRLLPIRYVPSFTFTAQPSKQPPGDGRHLNVVVSTFLSTCSCRQPVYCNDML